MFLQNSILFLNIVSLDSNIKHTSYPYKFTELQAWSIFTENLIKYTVGYNNTIRIEDITDIRYFLPVFLDADFFLVQLVTFYVNSLLMGWCRIQFIGYVLVQTFSIFYFQGTLATLIHWPAWIMPQLYPLRTSPA